jgi:hypothetical protein
MHRNRTWQIDIEELRTQRNRILPIEGGDGSTLSLDFTTGVLDPRLLFTSTTNATFINSQGYVQFADANMFVNSAWTDANNTPTGWTLGTGTGSVSRSNETRTLTCAAQQYWWYQQPASRTGLTYSVSVEVTAVSGTILFGDIILAGSSTTIAWYKDGVLQATSTATPVTTGVITLIFTANSDNTILRLGLGSAGTNVTGSVTLRYPQFQQGQVPLRSYYENTSTSVARFNSARFDYNPTTLAPRGLLIEGSASTLNQYSEDFSNAYWSKPNASVSSISVTGPDNVAGTTRRIVEDNTTNQHGLRRQLSITSGTTYTMSVFVKPGSYDSFGFEMYASASNNAKAEVTSISGNTQTVTSASGVNATLARTPMTASGWYRYALTFTSTATQSGDFNILIKQTNSYAGNGTNYMDVYGFMLETGSGASSYIPTGASTGNRAKDVCNITGSNFSSWFVDGPGTIVAQSDNVKVNTRNLLCEFNKDASNYIQMGVGAGAGSGEALFYNPNGFSQSGTTPSLNTAYKSAYVWDTNYFKMCLNGTLGSADTTGNILSSGMVNLSIGGDLTNPTDVYIKNGHIRSLKYWPTRLSDAQLQALTT